MEDWETVVASPAMAIPMHCAYGWSITGRESNTRPAKAKAPESILNF